MSSLPATEPVRHAAALIADGYHVVVLEPIEHHRPIELERPAYRSAVGPAHLSTRDHERAVDPGARDERDVAVDDHHTSRDVPGYGERGVKHREIPLHGLRGGDSEVPRRSQSRREVVEIGDLGGVVVRESVAALRRVWELRVRGGDAQQQAAAGDDDRPHQ
jgi:hypothetical protein